MKLRKIVFLSGTRADFGKLKSLIEIITKSDLFEVHIFVTGMHMNPKYGKTVEEIEKKGYPNIFKYYNHDNYYTMDTVLAKTIEGFSHYVKDIQPDLIVLHGDRVEALAGAIVGSLNNILTAHIEGGEISGTVDESIRHSVSKMSHIHLVSNFDAKRRLIQMGEDEDSIWEIGSPDIDIMLSDNLPDLSIVKSHYDIDFNEYALLLFHPVTTEYSEMGLYTQNLVEVVIESDLNYIVIYPNNDMGSDFILLEYKKFLNNKHFRVFPSIRFEYFLTLLKNSKFIIGNSSAGIREAPAYGVPTINIGSRQNSRTNNTNIINCTYDRDSVEIAIRKAMHIKLPCEAHFGKGNSDRLFLDLLLGKKFWDISKQKFFKDISS